MSDPRPIANSRRSKIAHSSVAGFLPAAKKRTRSLETSENVVAAPLDESTLDHLLVESLVDYAIFVISQAGLIVRWNLGSSALFGYAGSEAMGRHFSMLFTPEDVAAGAPERELAEALSGRVTGHDRWHVRKDGSRFWGMNTARTLYDAGSALLGFTKIVRDLTERYEASEAARESANRLRTLVATTQHAALHDDLTGLANKQLFREHLDRAVARSKRRSGRTFALLFLDLDKFKAANDRHGHLMADRLLVQVSRRLERALRTEDVVGRVGGDEFAVLVEDIEGVAGAVAIADHVLQSFAMPFTFEKTQVSTSASIGIALASDYGSVRFDADRLLEDADLAMYEAKSSGGGRHVLFFDAMRTRAGATIQRDHELREALERNALRMYYRPIVDLRTRRLVGVKALARWEDPELGLLFESDVRTRPDKGDVRLGIDLWIFKNAVAQLHAWQHRHEELRGVTISVHLSPVDLERPGLAPELRAVLAQTEVAPGSLVVDIDDAGSIDHERFVDTLNELRAIGLDICLGEFGSNHTSLRDVSRLPATTMRIGRSFISDLTISDRGVAIARAMLAFAHSLGLRCIAEGVETEEQRAILLELGCDEGHGSLFSDPLSAEATLTILERPASF